jgi:hypothetical protein
MQTKELIQASTPKKLFSQAQIMLVGLMVQSTIDLMDEGMFNVAMPAMQEAFSLPIDVLSLVVAIRYLARIGLMPVYGFVGDRFGKKRTFTAGLAIFVIGSFVSLFSPSISWLVIGRALQGMGGGILPLAMAIISDQFSRERRGQILGTWNASAPRTTDRWIADRVFRMEINFCTLGAGLASGADPRDPSRTPNKKPSSYKHVCGLAWSCSPVYIGDRSADGDYNQQCLPIRFNSQSSFLGRSCALIVLLPLECI